jgi:lipopolysaccharide transport system permease protein
MHTEDSISALQEETSGIERGSRSSGTPGSYRGQGPIWQGDLFFALSNLIIKDFKIRYRNMSLGVFWSLLNPIIMMGVLTFVFTKVNPNNSVPHFPLFLLCGIVPFNFFTAAWSAGTTSIVDNAGLVKRVPIPREIVPIAAVLSNCLHLLIQIGLLFALSFASGYSVNRYWVWLPYLWTMEIIFICGLSFFTSAINVYVRDTRYVVESINTVMFWMVGIFYNLSIVPQIYRLLYQLNPVAALILAMRNIIIEGHAPRWQLLVQLTGVALFAFLSGFIVFQRLKRRFYDHL